MPAGIIMLMTARGLKSYVPFSNHNGIGAVVNVNQHGGGYLESLYSFNEIKIIVTYA